MTVEAAFKVNTHVETRLQAALTSELEYILGSVFDCDASIFVAILREEYQPLLDLNREVRKLSYTLQRDVVTCQFVVTLSSALDPGTVTLGTKAFGLQQVRGDASRTLIEAKAGMLQ
jgi:hypothetical protein